MAVRTITPRIEKELVAAAGEAVTVGDAVMAADVVMLTEGAALVGLGGDTVVNVPITQALVNIPTLDRTLQK